MLSATTTSAYVSRRSALSHVPELLCYIADYSHGPHCRRAFRSPLLARARTFANATNVHRVKKDDQDPSPWSDLFRNLPKRPPQTTVPQRTRRQTMTAREIGVFDEMFNMVFDTVASSKDDPTRSGLGIKKGTVSDFFGKLRSQSLKSVWTPASYEELDQKKEAMNLCDTDSELLEWAMKEVFAESEKYLQDAVQAMEEQKSSLPMLQPPTYPYLIALLMRAFRVKYNDPHLALSIFDYARHLSTASYVFGCSTQAYNELIETRWKAFRDLKGVHDALEEMHINGVQVDSQTRNLVDAVRQEVGARNAWAEETEFGSGEMWNMLEKIEQYAGIHRMDIDADALETSRSKRINQWKSQMMEDREDDAAGFDKWDSKALAAIARTKRPGGRQKM